MLSTTARATKVFVLYKQAALIQKKYEWKHGRTTQTIKADEQTQPEKPDLLRFPTDIFFLWRTRNGSDLALSALENNSPKHAGPDSYKDK